MVWNTLEGINFKNKPILQMDRDGLLDVIAWMGRRIEKLEEDGKKERAELFSLLRAKR